MSRLTTMRDNPKTLLREAWQCGKCVFTWTKTDIEKMNKETPHIPAWGCFPADRPGTATMRPNADVTGLAPAQETTK